MNHSHQPISLSELGPILRDYAQMMGFADEDLLWDWYSGSRSEFELPEGQFEFAKSKTEFKRRLGTLYTGELPESFPLGKLQKLLRAFNDPEIETDMPGLMAEWLEAATSDSPIIGLSLRNDFLPASYGAEKSGLSAGYKTAMVRLCGFECGFVTVSLGPNGTSIKSCDDLVRQLDSEISAGDVTLPPHTRPHVHPGDELIFVRKGHVHVRMDNAGTFTVLGECDYVHFNSEIPHSLWNLDSEPCEALVVRFFQLERHGTRAQQRKVLDQIRENLDELRDLYLSEEANTDKNRALKERTGRKLLTLWDGIHAWVRDRTRAPSDRLRTSTPPRRVLDYVGISSFLTTFLTQEFPDEDDEDERPIGDESVRVQADEMLRDWYRQYSKQEQDWGARIELKKRLDDFLGPTFGNRSKRIEQFFTGVAYGQHKDDIADVAALAKELRIPRILLDGYLAPAVLRTIVVRGANLADVNYGFDYVSSPDGDANHARNAKYWIPGRTLVNSDMSITLLELTKPRPQSESLTDWNRHAGFEVLIPIQGTVRVEFKNREDLNRGLVDCDHERILVYRSSWSHRVLLGPNCKTARVLVLRFNIIDPLAIEKFRPGGVSNLNAAITAVECKENGQSLRSLKGSPDDRGDAMAGDGGRNSDRRLLVVENEGRTLLGFIEGESEPVKRVELDGKTQELFWCLYQAKTPRENEWNLVTYKDIWEEVWRDDHAIDFEVKSAKLRIQQTKAQLLKTLAPLNEWIGFAPRRRGGYQLKVPE